MPTTVSTNRQGKPKFLIYLLMLLLLVLPSLVPWRYEPYPSYYVDTIVAMLAALLATYLLLQSYKVKPSMISVGLLIFALYLPIQALIIQFPYAGSALYLSSFFVLLALLLTAVLSVPKDILGYVTYSILWGIVVLATIQLCLYVTQLAITDVTLKNQLGWLLFSGEGGQVGQRNNFSHILMWGIIAVIILERMNKLPIIVMWGLILCYAIAMAHTGSRSVLLYIAGLTVMASYQLFTTKEKNNQVFSHHVLIALAIILLAQFVLPFVMSMLTTSTVGSGVERLTNSGYLPRWFEWQKAWLAFLDAPLLGHGWGSYGFQSFWLHDQVATMGMPREDNYFSHSHNILLQLLAEVGLLGTLIVVIPILFILLKAFFKYTADAMTFGLVMICVISLLHSMVELPLWSSNLLIIFLLVFFLIVRRVNYISTVENQPSAISKASVHTSRDKWTKIGSIFTLLIMVSVLTLFMDHEKQVRKQLTLGVSIADAQKTAIGVQGEYIPFYKKYADRSNVFKADIRTNDNKQIQRSDKLLVKNMQVFPYYTYMAIHTIYLQKMGKQDDVKVWLDKLILYYPRILPALIQMTQDYPEEMGYLQPYLLEQCNAVVDSQIYGLNAESCGFGQGSY